MGGDEGDWGARFLAGGCALKMAQRLSHSIGPTVVVAETRGGLHPVHKSLQYVLYVDSVSPGPLSDVR